VFWTVRFIDVEIRYASQSDQSKLRISGRILKVCKPTGLRMLVNAARWRLMR
jgi:hypothetical protein